MQNGYASYTCCHCDGSITFPVNGYSMDRIQLPLCRTCQSWYYNLRFKPTPYTKKIYLDLKRRGFRVVIEHFDGHKSVDIVAKDAMVHIEVDGSQHNINGELAIRDLWRTYYSYIDGYFTLRIPNSAVYNDLEQTSRAVSKILEENRKRTRDINKTNLYGIQRRLLMALVRMF